MLAHRRINVCPKSRAFCGLFGVTQFPFGGTRFGGTINHELERLPSPQHAEAIEITNTDGHEAVNACEAVPKWNDDHGCSSHGIDLGYCPAGCGSGPDD